MGAIFKFLTYIISLLRISTECTYKSQEECQFCLNVQPFLSFLTAVRIFLFSLHSPFPAKPARTIYHFHFVRLSILN